MNKETMGIDLYKSILEQSKEGYAVFEIKTHKNHTLNTYVFLYVNKSFKKVIGLEGLSVTNLNIYEVLKTTKGENFECFKLLINKLQNSTRETFEYFFKSINQRYEFAISHLDEKHLLVQVTHVQTFEHQASYGFNEDNLLNNQKEENYLKNELYHLLQSDSKIFDFLQNAALDGLWYWDLENPEYEWMSPNYWETFGYDPSEKKHLTSEWQEIINPEDLIIARENLNKHCSDSNYPYDQIVRFKHKNGSTVWIRCRGLAIRDEKGQAIRMLGAHTDITEVKESELDRDEALWRFKALFEKGPVAVAFHRMIYDSSGKAVNYHFIDANKSYKTLMGVNPVGMLVTDAFPGIEKDPFDWIGVFGRVAQSDQTIGFDQYLQANQRWYNCVAYAYKKDHFVATFTEITERKRAQAALLEREEQYRLLTMEMQLGLALHEIICDDQGVPVDYRFINVNKRFEALTGLHYDDVVGKRVLELLPGTEKSWIEKYGKVALTGQSIQFEDYASELDKYFSVAAYAPKPGHFAVILDDITEEKQSLLVIKESEARFQQISENVEEVFYLVNPENSHLFYINQAYEKIFGRTCQSLYDDPKSFLKSVYEPDQDFVYSAFEKSISTGIFNEEYRILRPDGNIRWVRSKSVPIKNEEGNIYRHVGTAVDITEYKTIQAQLNINVKDLMESQRIAKIGTCRLDVNTDDVVWTEELFKMFGLDPKLPAPEYSDHMKLYSPESWERISYAIDKTRTSGEPYELELKTIKRDGSEGWIRVRGEAEKNSEGNIINVWAAAQDVSAYKKTEQALIKAKEAAEAANQSKSLFLSNMSHEIRTPMNGFMGTLQLLDRTELSKEQRELLDIAQSSAKSLLTLVNDILDYSRIEAGQMPLNSVEFDLDALVKETFSFFKVSSDACGLKLMGTIDKDLALTYRGDAFRLKQILSNLLGNAIKFTESGRVSLKVEIIHETDEKVTLKFLVKDTGLGISEEQVDHLFTRFHQLDNSTTKKYGGSGLGLAICKGLVEKMGGEIWVESKVGHGSSFYFTCSLEKTNKKNRLV
jgi:PAS domain S-box-containing protein